MNRLGTEFCCFIDRGFVNFDSNIIDLVDRKLATMESQNITNNE